MNPSGSLWADRMRGLFGRSLLLILLGLGAVMLAFAIVVQHQKQAQQALVGVSVDSIRDVARQGLDKGGESIARLLADSLANPLYYFDLARIGDLLRSAQQLPDIDYVLVFDEQGRIVHDGTRDISSFGQRMEDGLGRSAAATTELLVQQAGEVVEVALPIWIGDQRIGGVRVGLSLQATKALELSARQDMAERAERAKRRSLQLMISVFLGLAGAGALLTLIVTRGLVRPIQRLAAASRRLASGRFDIQLPGRRVDEVGALERDFVRMAEALAKHEQEVLRIAYTDPLTGLANRLAFRERLDQRLVAARASGETLSLLFIDLDDFKRINDSLGHDAGDHVLEQVATRLSQCLPEAEAEPLLARLGGDEFVILVSALSREVARQVAEQILLELQKPFNAAGRQAFLGASIGITQHPDDAQEARSLLKAGDMAMYQAKLGGKNCIRFFNAAMHQAVTETAQLEQGLRGAWERGELSLSFQPIYDLANRRLVGAESLLRWAHPTLGTIEPSVFVLIAEQSGMIEDIGSKVLRAACVAAKGWQFEDSTPFVSVNVSALQLRKGDLAERVAEVLRDTGLDPSRLHLELTETSVMGDELQVAVLLSRLRALGVKIWLDDFGTGYSGLSHLRQVPVDGVKIDKSFVLGMLNNPDDLALTSAIIALAHSLGFTAVAEGVENEAQFELLRERGCDHAQGYWLGRPVPDAAFSTDHLPRA